MSADGSIAVGTTTGYPGSEAYRRMFSSSVEALGHLDPGDVYSQATGVSADGNTIVGFSDQKPFVWDSINGMRDLRQLMILNGLDVTHWSAFYTNSVARISADGKTIAGNGASTLGNEVWVAVNVENVNYAKWRAVKFTPDEQADESISGPSADPDHDDIPNVLEFGFGLSPKQPNGAIASTLTNENGVAVFRFTVSSLVTGVAYTTQTSTDLVSWCDLASTPTVESTTGISRTLKVSVPNKSTKIFARLKATLE